MVAMIVNGKAVGTFEDAIRAIRDAATNKVGVEFREPDGRMIATFDPSDGGPLVPWDPSVTWADLERIRAGEFLTLDEAKKRMGWE